MLFRDLDRIDNDGEERGVEIPSVFCSGSLRCPKCNENGRKPKQFVSVCGVVQASSMNLTMTGMLRAKHWVWRGPERDHILLM